MSHSPRSADVQARPPKASSVLDRIASFLGGRRVFRHAIESKLDVHDAIRQGIPGRALFFLQKNVQTIRPEDVGHAVGVSIRTVRRHGGSQDKRLNCDQSSRTWKFVEILLMTTEVFGSQLEAERWLTAPAMALNQWRPIDLLVTSAGAELVEQLLGRLNYGVYT